MRNKGIEMNRTLLAGVARGLNWWFGGLQGRSLSGNLLMGAPPKFEAGSYAAHVRETGRGEFRLMPQICNVNAISPKFPIDLPIAATMLLNGVK
jgi:hypothetical protein